MGLFEDLYHRSGDVEEAFAGYLREQLRNQTFQSPDKIKEGFGLVGAKSLWPCVADHLATEAGADLISASAVVECLRSIVQRRHNIAHAADMDPEDGTLKVCAIVAVLEPVSGRPSKQEHYLQFWTEFKPVVERRGWTRAQPQPQNWWNMPGGVSDTTFALSFSRFGCRSELYFEHSDPATNLRRWRVLNDRRAEIEARFGDGLIFDELPRNKGCRIETRLLGVSVDRRDRWADIRN